VRAGNLHLKFYQALAPHSFTQSSWCTQTIKRLLFFISKPLLLHPD
jgi:hypothetical protein